MLMDVQINATERLLIKQKTLKLEDSQASSGVKRRSPFTNISIMSVWSDFTSVRFAMTKLAKTHSVTSHLFQNAGVVLKPASNLFLILSKSPSEMHYQNRILPETPTGYLFYALQ